MWRRLTLGLLVAVAAGWVLTGVGGPPPATAARPLGATGMQHGVVSQECHLHARVTVDRSPSIMIALRICDRP